MNLFSFIEPLESRIAPAAIVVNTLADSIDAAGSKTVSLRDAIIAANAHPGADTIVFKSGIVGTIDLLHGEMLVTDTLTIKGPGAGKLLLNAGGNSRILDIDDSDNSHDHRATISGLSFLNGNGTGANESGNGGAIFSSESLALSNSVVSGSTASGSNEGRGGGVYVEGGQLSAKTISIRNCTISGNSASSIGGGLYLFAADGVQVTHSAILDNSSEGYAGGVQMGSNEHGVILLSNDTVSANQSPGRGGGVAFTSGGAPIEVSGSQIINNTSSGTGGGIYMDMLGVQGSAVIRKSVISDNSALSGGGMYAPFKTAFTITGSTLDGNHATDGKGGGLYLAGSFQATLAPAHISASHFDNNTSSQNGAGLSAIGGVALGISSSTFDGNNAGGGGGGLFVTGQSFHRVALQISGGEIAQNTTAGDGGGLYAPGDGDVTISGTKVLNNTAHAPIGGGGLCLNSTGTVKLTGLIVSGNDALGNNGGGVSINVNGSATFLIKGGSFAGNEAGQTGGALYLSGTGQGSILGVKITGNIAGQDSGGVNNNITPFANVKSAGNTITGNVAPLDPDFYGL